MTIQQQIEGKIQIERKTNKQKDKQKKTSKIQKQKNRKKTATKTQKKKQIGRQKENERREDISINIGRRHNTRK